jgi:hypothetical protein
LYLLAAVAGRLHRRVGGAYSELPRIRPPPGLVLFLLAPAVGELLSGSSPPAEFFTPFGFTIMTALYGGGAVLCRELKVRWQKGMGSLLLLGAAYGVLEEGLMVASFFNPAWPDLGALGVFGRWLGVNWVWAVELALYHAIVSITVPVMLVELVYPDRRGTPWLGGGWFRAVALIFAADVVGGLIIFSVVTGYKPTEAQIIFSVLLAVGFALLARRLPADWARRGSKRMRRPLFYGALTILGAVASGAVFWVLPGIKSPLLHPVIVMALGALLDLLLIRSLADYDWRRSTDLHRFAVAAGSLSLFVAFDFLQELDRTRTDNKAGMSLVGLSFLVGLALLGLKVRRRSERRGP